MLKAYDESRTHDDHYNLEIFSLIWLNSDVNTNESQNKDQKLRTIINQLKKFQDKQECQRYIEQRSQTDRLVFIVSGRLGEQVIPSIHQLRQISSIYIYCSNKKHNEEWTQKYTKIKAVVFEFDDLVSRLKMDHEIRMKVEEPLSINIFTTSTDIEKSTTGVNGQFVFSQLLIECLLRIKPNERDKIELISRCMNVYEGNSMELANLHDFEQNYSYTNALYWYTRESFFYKTLNKALRSQDIHMLFLFRSFIIDLYEQLQQYQSKRSLQVYRSQLMSADELDVLKQCINQYISVNSFLSTSNERSVALFYIGDAARTINLERVLFEIDADPRVVTTKPFADISTQSNFVDESEVLFMTGSIFRLNHISRGNDQVWIIRMALCNDDEHDLKQVMMHMKDQKEKGETSLRTLGKLLWEMGQLTLAEKYYIRLLDELPLNDPLLSILYEELGKIASQNGDYNMSIKWHHKSFTIKQQNTSVVSANSLSLVPNIHSNDEWIQIGITIAGGFGYGSALCQLWNPIGIYVDNDDDQTVVITDYDNRRVVEWKSGATSGQVLAGGNGYGNRMDQLSGPTDVTVDKKTDSLIICDILNRRVVQWPRRGGTSGRTIISDVTCTGLTIDADGFLYICNGEKNEVRRYGPDETTGIVVAGGNGRGDHHDQLNFPTFVFIDEDHSVYVSDWNNHRVMKWAKDAKEGSVVAGGHGQGNALTQLSNPRGVIVDQLGTIYVADCRNHRILRWPKKATQGSIAVGRNDNGQQVSQLTYPTGLAFDRYGNLYAVDRGNDRIQKFSINRYS